MTIVRDFLQWLDTAPANERAEAAGALARAYLCSDLTVDELAPAEGLMLKLLDDPSPLVRRALADAVAASPAAPQTVVIALAGDQPQISAPVYALSPLLIDADLLDGVTTGGEAVQAAIASRAVLPSAVSAALAELGSAEACQILAENDGAEIAPSSINRIVERFGEVAAIARRCWRATIFRGRAGKIWSPGCRRRSPALSPIGPGSRRIAPAVSRARPARKPRSQSPPTGRRPNSGRSFGISVPAVSSPPAWFCARCYRAIPPCSKKRWPS
jgi:hypothetical protein